MMILKKILMICLIIAMAGAINSIDVYAATGQNITAKYKTSVTKLLRRFDSYFWLGCKKSVKVEFDIYAKSTMSYMDYPEYMDGKRLSYVQKKLKKNMKLYFGTNALAKFRKNNGETALTFSNPSNIVQNINGITKYLGGNWAETAYPRGYVLKILKKSSKKFEVTYKIMWYDSVEKKIVDPCWYTSYTREMGVYKISLKKANNLFGFIITDIKRIKSNIKRY